MKLIQNVPKIQDADIHGKVILMRVDHNVVKKGIIEDPTRIEATIPTIIHILRRGGHLILMTHVGRPKNKEKGTIEISDESSVQPIVEYLNRRLHLNFVVPQFSVQDQRGILAIDTSINPLIEDLKKFRIDGLYLPNTRWFMGEEAKGDAADDFGRQLAGLADIYVNDAFGSWQPHVSTMAPTRYLPSYSGLLMQKEIDNLYKIFSPERSFLGIVAGSKFDTKIGPLLALFEQSDHLILGGVIYNAYLCAKYGVKIKGIEEDDIEAARAFVSVVSKEPEKLIELPYIVESDTLEGKKEGQYRVRKLSELKEGMELNYVLDAAPECFEDDKVRSVIQEAHTIFTNAVMGFVPNFPDGTVAMYKLIDQNEHAQKLFGGGDTIQEFKNLLPNIFMKATDLQNYYFFTGGGTILMAIQEGSAYGLDPIKALIANMENNK